MQHRPARKGQGEVDKRTASTSSWPPTFVRITAISRPPAPTSRRTEASGGCSREGRTRCSSACAAVTDGTSGSTRSPKGVPTAHFANILEITAPGACVGTLRTVRAAHSGKACTGAGTTRVRVAKMQHAA